MSGIKDGNSSDTENLCVVCFKNVEIYSLGLCDHAVCFECSTRMRVLCKQNECPICRQLLPKVIFTKTIEPFATLFPKFERSNLQDRRFGICFSVSSIQKYYFKLLEHRCGVCEENDKNWPFKTFQQLKDHMRREHELFYCDICTENLKIFSFERRCYTRQELGLHRRKGDPDNTSHRGHPLCEFCDSRFMDSEELFRHLRRNHLFCHFCDADGKHQFYNNMEDLVRHFRDEHYLCEEGECKGLPLTAVFRTDIDCKAHKAMEHTRFMTKSGAKQARTLELEFTLAPRSRTDNTRNRRYNSGRDRIGEDYSTNSYNIEPDGPGGGGEDDRRRIFVNPLTPQNFPVLGQSTSNITVHTRPASINFSSKMNSNFTNEDFPTLGGGGGGGPKSSSAVSISSNSASRNTRAPEVTITSTVRGKKGIEKTIENFPTLGGPSTSSGGRSTVRLSVNNGHDANPPKVSIQVNHRPNGSITTHITTSASPSIQHRSAEAFPALGSDVTKSKMAQPQWVPAKQKKEPKTKNVAPAPQLPPSSLEQFPTLSKKKSSVSVPVSSNWVNLNNFNSANSYVNSSSNVKSNDNANSDSNVRKVEAKPSSFKQKQSEINDKIGENESRNKATKKKNKSTEETNNNNDGHPKHGVAKKLSELKIGNLSNSNDTTSEEPLSKDTKPPPPPGFSVKPPPGLSPNAFPALGVASDFTFTSSSGQSYSIMPVSSYRQPPHFSSRNQDLIKQFMAVLNGDAIKEFKTYSDLFRNGAYPTDKYYEHCKQVLGDKFDDIFPELLVLLPNIEKQQELYRVYNGKGKKHMVVCENCKQVIFNSELKGHYTTHVLDNQFPTLGKTERVNNSWRKT